MICYILGTSYAFYILLYFCLYVPINFSKVVEALDRPKSYWFWLGAIPKIEDRNGKLKTFCPYHLLCAAVVLDVLAAWSALDRKMASSKYKSSLCPLEAVLKNHFTLSQNHFRSIQIAIICLSFTVGDL